MSGNDEQTLQSLTLQSSLLVLLRALYGLVLDYCVLRSPGDSEKPLVFTKDQLVSLIERNNPETTIGDLPKLVARGVFKPLAPPDPENIRVLVVGDDGAGVSSFKDALAQSPSFPEWWEAPVPLAICSAKKLYFNPAAIRVFGPDVKRLASCNLPDRDEFLVELEGARVPCLLAFRRLAQNVFILEDSTGDAALAEDIAWWASLGKAWAAMLDGEKRSWRRCTESEVDALSRENTVLPCVWEGRLLGYFCVEKLDAEQSQAAGSKRAGYSRKAGNRPEKEPDVKTSDEKKPLRRYSASARKNAGDPLKALGPQAMGLLAPGPLRASSEAQTGKDGHLQPEDAEKHRKRTKRNDD